MPGYQRYFFFAVRDIAFARPAIAGCLVRGRAFPVTRFFAPTLAEARFVELGQV